MKKDIAALFCLVDDFYQSIDDWVNNKSLANDKLRSPTRIPEMSYSEIMTIILMYNQSPCKKL